MANFIPVLSYGIIEKTSVPDVLPSGQCFKRCTAKDNADVTRSLPANGCIHACNNNPFVDWISVKTDWWVLIRTTPVSVYWGLWSDDRMVWSTFCTNKYSSLKNVMTLYLINSTVFMTKYHILKRQKVTTLPFLNHIPNKTQNNRFI